MKCLCGCGRDIDSSQSRGERRLFIDDTHRQRYARRRKRYIAVTHASNGSVKPILRYPGAKWLRAEWIIEHFPPFRTYVEPFFGSGGVFFSLPAAPEYAVLNDKSKSVVNFFEILRTRGPELIAQIELTPWARDEYDAAYTLTGDPLEDARRFVVRCWQAHGTRLSGKTGWRNRGSAGGGLTYSLWNQLPERLASVVERLKYAEIENREALDIIARFSDQEDCLLYVDPPYEFSTRSGAMYEHEMKDEASHVELIEALEKHIGPVVLSGYDNPLYGRLLSHWKQVTMPSLAEKGRVRTESLWLNKAAARNRQLSLFDEEVS